MPTFIPVSNRDPNTQHYPCDICGKTERIVVYFADKPTLLINIPTGKLGMIACKSCLLQAIDIIDKTWLDPTLDEKNRTSSYQK